MTNVIPYGHQSISEADLAAVCEALRADFLTGGPKIEEFEHEFAKLVGAKHAVAVNSATSALHLAMCVAGLGPGDRVATSPNTFLASANCAAYVGAIPDFSDIDSVSYNLDPAALNETWKPDTKAVVAVDYAGQSCDMPEIARIVRERGGVVIEDASHAVGGRFINEGRIFKVGGHPWADMTVFSFHPVKTMTTGEGGMLVTDNADWAAKARHLRSHGMERQDFLGLGADSNPELGERGPWYYEMQALGYNYRLTDIQCALGLSQLRKLDQFITRRRSLVAAYNDAFADVTWLKPPGLTNAANRDHISWHLYTILVDFKRLGKTRTQVMKELKEHGVGTQVLYIPVYLQPWYRQTYGYRPGKCPVAEEYYRQSLSLPLYPAMDDGDLDRVVRAVRKLSEKT